MNYETIDSLNLELSTDWRDTEQKLVENLEITERYRVYEKFGYRNMFDYCTMRLKLPEGTTSGLLAVVRKSREVPELRKALSDGVISPSQAKRINRVVGDGNAEMWIEMAATKKQREVEKAVAATLPEPPPSSRMKPVGGEMSELRLVIPEQLRRKLERLMEVRGSDAIRALEYALTETLKRQDPMEKAKRNIGKDSSRNIAATGKRQRIPNRETHEVVLRDEARCTARLPNGERCAERRWLQVHHRRPVSRGGGNSATNLVLLCSGHHRLHHRGVAGHHGSDYLAGS